MKIDNSLIIKSKIEIEHLKQKRKQMSKNLMHIMTEYKRTYFMKELEILDNKIQKAEFILDKYEKDGTGIYYLMNLVGLDSNIKERLHEIKKEQQEKDYAEKKKKQKREDNLVFAAIMVPLLLLFLFISWKIIAFFSDGIFGTDYEIGIFFYICIVLFIIGLLIKG